MCVYSLNSLNTPGAGAGIVLVYQGGAEAPGGCTASKWQTLDSNPGSLVQKSRRFICNWATSQAGVETADRDR